MPDAGGLRVARDVALAPRTTLELGGPAAHFVEAHDEADVARALAWAAARALPLHVLGGGSNVVVPDEGVPGLVVAMETRGVTWATHGDRVRVVAAAGEPWDAFVADAVARNLGGLECLAGIPGRVGAVPIQNVGAYGQEVSSTIASVRVFDRERGTVTELSPEDCEFGYRSSAFKRAPDRHVVLAVTFDLVPGAAPLVAYEELARAIERVGAPTLANVRETVLALRRKKSMVIDPADENRRSVGSFFVNPVVDAALAEAVVARALAAGLVATPDAVPRWPDAAGSVKLAAGWLVEQAGFARGTRRGAVGISSRHALALVHHGGGSSTALVALAREVRDAVRARFGVALVPEPVAFGTSAPLLD